jgi:hypothetical protein
VCCATKTDVNRKFASKPPYAFKELTVSDNTIRDAVMGQDATIAALEEIKAKFERGEVSCVALRLFRPDGTWEDLAIGGDDGEKAEALANMRKLYLQAN